jgi:hypothetical protein
MTITELVAACKRGDILLERKTLRAKPVDGGAGGGSGGPATVDRWFWNIKGKTNTPVSILLGDITKPDDRQPFLLKQPAPHKDAGADNTGMGALTAISDPEETEAWKEFNEWYVNKVIDSGCVTSDKIKPGITPEMKRALQNLMVAEIGVPPTPDDPKRAHFCLWQKLQLGGRIPELATKFMYVGMNEEKHKLEKQGTFDPATTLRAGTRVCSIMDLGELKFSQGKWRSMLYTRVLLVPAKATVAKPDHSKIVMGGFELDLDETTPASDAAAASNGAGAGTGAGAGAARPPSPLYDGTTLDDLTEDAEETVRQLAATTAQYA